jgi:APA family basic amino acid/polyamine antiporter
MPVTQQNSPRAPDAKALGFWMCTALVVGNMIGSGILLLPALLAPLGWNAVLGWILTISGGLCLAFVFGRLAREFPKAGGPYAYTREAFGPAPAFLVAWSYWISIWAGNAAIATGAVSYLSVFFPSIGYVPGLHALITCGVIWLLTAINCRGVRIAGGLQLLTTIFKVLPLLAVIILAAMIIGGDGGASLAPFRLADIHLSSVTAAATLALWGLLGLESASVATDKVKNPDTTIPRATLVGTALAGVIYLLVCSAVILLLPEGQIASSHAPLADFVARYAGGNLGFFVTLFAVISGFGALNGWILLQGEMPYAMAKGGVFPSWLAKSSRWGTPVRAHVTSSLLLTLVVLMNYSKSMSAFFSFLLLLSTAAVLVMYLVCALAALKLERSGRLTASPLVLLLSLGAMLYALWAIYGAGAESIAWNAALLLAGVPVYFVMRWRRRAQIP